MISWCSGAHSSKFQNSQVVSGGDQVIFICYKLLLKSCKSCKNLVLCKLIKCINEKLCNYLIEKCHDSRSIKLFEKLRFHDQLHLNY